jgi:hypothetical protein
MSQWLLGVVATSSCVTDGIRTRTIYSLTAALTEPPIAVMRMLTPFLFDLAANGKACWWIPVPIPTPVPKSYVIHLGVLRPTIP